MSAGSGAAAGAAGGRDAKGGVQVTSTATVSPTPPVTVNLSNRATPESAGAERPASGSRTLAPPAAVGTHAPPSSVDEIAP